MPFGDPETRLLYWAFRPKRLVAGRKEALVAKSVNKVILIGNLGKDPEVKYTQAGMAVARFSLATSDRVKDKDGNWQDRTEWHNLVAFQRTAEIAAEYLKKGGKVYIEGRLHSDSWDDKETGQKKYKTEIIVNDLVLLGGRDASGGEGGGGGYSGRTGAGKTSGFDQRTPEPEPSQAPAGAEITDEDIPF
jgi:single-strand DNA-binding protein